ncbi:MAG TPA: FtsQ-type POTRA domain-containing protein [Gemmatimonadaceae bacterium]|nr:FtsQ-type POTRA domain-containing protein [Gemmatimonadaceae bacterium]
MSADASGTPAPRSRRRRWLIPAAIAAGVFLLILSPLWAPLLLRRLTFFRVRHVEVVGAKYVAPREVLQRLRVDTTASVWDPLAPLERRVREHPLVRDVRVERRLPGTLVVRLVERAPVGLIATPNGLRPYDERGRPLSIDPTAADVDAPILSAGLADTAILRLLGAARTQAPALYRRVSEIRREGDGSELLVVLDSLPVRTLPDVTLQRLTDLELVERDLARRGLRPIELDLRYRDQVIARLQ